MRDGQLLGFIHQSALLWHTALLVACRVQQQSFGRHYLRRVIMADTRSWLAAEAHWCCSTHLV